MSWRAYYADGSTVDSTDVESWRELEDGVVGVVEFHEPPQRKTLYGADWLWREDGRWQESGTMWDGYVERPHPDAIRCAGMPDAAWDELRRRMVEDRDWPEVA